MYQEAVIMNNISYFFKLIISINILFLFVLSNNSISNDDLDLYRIALPCSGCHSVEKDSSIPSLCGLEEEYIFSALVDYKLGVRDNYLMYIIAKGYSDSDLKKLSSYFSSTYSIRSCK
jgi:cytochrome c553